MAQRSITSFFAIKSPTQSARPEPTPVKDEDRLKKVLSSPQNKMPSPSKTISVEKTTTQLVIELSPQKKMVVVSPKKSPKPVINEKEEMQVDSPEDSENAPSISPARSDSNAPKSKVTRKRRRLSSSSSSASEESVANDDSFSTDYNDLDSMSAVDKGNESIATKEKKKPGPSRKVAVAKKKSGPKKGKSPGVAKKTAKKLQSTSAPAAKVETPKDSPKMFKTPEASGNKKEPVSSVALKPGEYDPSTEKYDSIAHAPWKAGEKTPFLCLARTLDYAEKTSSRNRTMEIVANFFSSVIRLSPDDLPATVFLCLGIVAPAHLGIETSVGEGALQRALSKATGRSVQKIKEEIQKTGDIGEVAELSRQVQPKLGFTLGKAPTLTIPGVFAKLLEIASMSGTNSQNLRIDAIVKMLTMCQGVEAKFLVRLLTGKLRVGLAEQSVLIALAHSGIYAKCKTPKERAKYWEDKDLLTSVAKSLRLAFAHCPDVERITKALEEAINEEGSSFVDPFLELPKKCPIVPGLPVKPMLAQPAKSLQEIVEKLGQQAKDEVSALSKGDTDKPGRTLACEYKYDGERAQIHVYYPKESDGSPFVKIFSRNQEDHTVRFNEVANRIATEAVLPAAKGKSLIIDSEIVAVDGNGRHLPFQMLAARKRKEMTAEEEEELKQTKSKEQSVPAYQAIAFVFDCIFIDGESLVADTLLERRRKIRECLQPIPGLVEWAISFEIDIDNEEHEVEEKVGQWLEDSVREGCEGLIVKTATSRYMVARRAPCWLKLKKDYIEGDAGGTAGMGGDSVDLAVVGAYWGSGKRTGRLGAFLLASYDSLDDQYETVCKLGTGLSDELLEQLTEQLMPLARPQGAPSPSYVNRSPGLPEPSVWLEPNVVWEIRAADLSLSNVHTSGLGSIPGAPERGVSLRFPRYVRARPDKKAEEATTSEAMCLRYTSQQQVQFAAEGNKVKSAAADDDFY